MPIRGLLALLAVLSVALAGCGDDAGSGATSTTSSVPGVIEYRLSGGIEGIEETWTIHEDGRVIDAAGTVRTVERARTEALFAEVADLGFFTMEGSYLPEDPCCDRFEYDLTVRDDGREHRVLAMDGGDEAPDDLFTIIAAVAAIVAAEG